MSTVASIITLLCAVAVLVMSLVLWQATGGAGWTKYHDPERAREQQAAEAQDSIADLFEEAGAGVEQLEELPNVFQFGLMPSGPDRHVVSVLTVGGPALLIAAITALGLLLGLKGPKPASADGATA